MAAVAALACATEAQSIRFLWAIGGQQRSMGAATQAVQLLRAEGFKDFVVEINGDNLQYASAAATRGNREVSCQRKTSCRSRNESSSYNGSYSVDQLPQRMARVDWCIVPSVWWEIFGLVISEAWMFKRPVIASNVGGPGERITHEKDGLLFDVADASLRSRKRSAVPAPRTVCGSAWWMASLPPATAEAMTDGYLSVYRHRAAELAS
jgi:glycosyltransferase involved in cell wall biosynthesis